MAGPDGIVWDDEVPARAAPGAAVDDIQWDPPPDFRNVRAGSGSRVNFGGVRAGSQSRVESLTPDEPPAGAYGPAAAMSAYSPMSQFVSWADAPVQNTTQGIQQAVQDIGGSATTFEPYSDLGDRRLVGVQEGALRTGASRLAAMGADALAQVPGPAMLFDAYQRATGGHTLGERAGKLYAINPERESFRSPAEEFIGTLGGESLAAAATWFPAAPEAVLAGKLGPELQGAAVADSILAGAPKPRVRANAEGELRPVSPEPIDVPPQGAPELAGAAPEQQATQVAADTLAPLSGAPVQRAPLPELSRPIRTAQDARAAELDARIAGDNLTPEQAAAVRQYADPVRSDTLTGMLASEHSFPAVERGQQYAAETGAPVQYLSLDMRNLGGLNAQLGHTGANPHIKALADLIREELPASHAELVRKGGDEFAAVLYGVGPDEAKAIGQRIEARADEYQRANGLHDVPHTKAGQQGGTGVYVAHSEVLPGMKVDDITGAADTALETRKKAGGFNGDRARETAGPARTDAGAAGPAAGGTDAALPAGVRGSEEAAATAARGDAGAKPPVTPQTSNKKAVINAERRARGVAEMDFEGRRAFGDSWDTAKAKYEAEGADDLARDYADNPRPLKTEDNARIAIHRGELNAQRREAVHEADEAMKAGDAKAEQAARAKLDNIDDRLEIADRAARQSIGETAHSLGITRMLTRDDYTPGELIVRAKVSKGSALATKEKARLERFGKEMEAADAHVEKVKRESLPRTSRAAQAEFDALAEQVRKIPKEKHMVCAS